MYSGLSDDFTAYDVVVIEHAISPLFVSLGSFHAPKLDIPFIISVFLLIRSLTRLFLAALLVQSSYKMQSVAGVIRFVLSLCEAVVFKMFIVRLMVSG
ncbi:MAG: hypothetical protein GXP08_17060 [Gammaproteobacteria bacterium]|nr:hypothetical protein [Gammaproteobacteria bacterium]